MPEGLDALEADDAARIPLLDQAAVYIEPRVFQRASEARIIRRAWRAALVGATALHVRAVRGEGWGLVGRS